MSYRRSGWSKEEDTSSKSSKSPSQMSRSLDLTIISKIVTNISIAIVFCFSIHSCRVTPEIIKQCQESCNTRFSSSQMDEVTARSCSCTEKTFSELGTKQLDGWVLPRK